MIQNAAIYDCGDGTVECSWQDTNPTPRSAILAIFHLKDAIWQAYKRKVDGFVVSPGFKERYDSAGPGDKWGPWGLDCTDHLLVSDDVSDGTAVARVHVEAGEEVA